MKAVVAAFNQEKALVGAFSVITNLRMQLFQALFPRPRARLQRHLSGHQHSTKMAMLGTTLMSGMMSHSEAEKMFRPWWDNMRYEHNHGA